MRTRSAAVVVGRVTGRAVKLLQLSVSVEYWNATPAIES